LPRWLCRSGPWLRIRIDSRRAPYAKTKVKRVKAAAAISNVNRGPSREFHLINALTADFRVICSLEHGTTGTKPPTETSATPDTSAATKAAQAAAATRTESMAEPSLKPLKAILETIRDQADFALKQLQNSEEERSMRWKCKDCRYIKHFTRPVPLEAAGRCPRCKSISFQCLP
jgi:predicted Zn-ribbon and HTH transcriptional regulator